MFCFNANVMPVIPNLIEINYKNFIRTPVPPSFGYGKVTGGDALTLKQPLEEDVTEFSRCNKSKEIGFLTLSQQEIADKILLSAKKHENLLGDGSEAKVFKIEGTKLCARIPYFSGSLKNSRISFNLREKDKINHVVAKFSNGVTIMNLVEGFTLEGRFSKTLPQDERNKALLKLPESAFHSLFKQICHAKDNGMIFDCNSANLILNPKEKSLTAIDFYEMDPDYPELVKPLRHILEAVTNSDYPEHKVKCVGKIILGALEELNPEVKPCLPLNEFKFVDFMDAAQVHTNLSKSKEWAMLKDILSQAEVLKLKELNDIDTKNKLASKINEAKKLIKTSLL